MLLIPGIVKSLFMEEKDESNRPRGSQSWPRGREGRMNEIIIGRGKVLIYPVVRGDVIGIGFKVTDTEHPIDEYLGELSAELTKEIQYDTIIWLENVKGARVLQDKVNAAVLALGGFKPDELYPSMIRGEK